ncbi:hypothetical protein Tco_0775404 [Tanacetum coccineum]
MEGSSNGNHGGATGQMNHFRLNKHGGGSSRSRVSRTQSDIPCTEFDKAYFQSYSHVGIHEEMIKEVHPQLPSSDATMNERPTGKVGMYTRFFDYANYCIPFSNFFVYVLTHFRIPFSQLSVFGSAKHRTVTLLPTSVPRPSRELSASIEREFVEDAGGSGGGDQEVASVGGHGSKSAHPRLIHCHGLSPRCALTTATTVTAFVSNAATTSATPVDVGNDKDVPTLFRRSGSDFVAANIRAGGDADVDLQEIYIPEWSLTKGFELNDGRSCANMIDHFTPAFFKTVRGMEHEQLFVEFNVSVARNLSLSSEAKDESMEVAQLRTRVSSLEAIEGSLRGEVASAKEHNDLLEQERSALSQNHSLVNQENFHPHLLNAIAGRRWLLTHGMKLLMAKCLNSTEYMEALGNAFGRAIWGGKGYRRLGHGIEHGQAGRCLSDLEAYNPSAGRLLVICCPFDYLAKKDAGTWDVMDLLRLDDVVAEVVEFGGQGVVVAKKLVTVGWEDGRGTLLSVFPFLKDGFDMRTRNLAGAVQWGCYSGAESEGKGWRLSTEGVLYAGDLDFLTVRGSSFPLRSFSLYDPFPSASVTSYGPSHLGPSFPVSSGQVLTSTHGPRKDFLYSIPLMMAKRCDFRFIALAFFLSAGKVSSVRKHLKGNPHRDSTFQSISGRGYPSLGHALLSNRGILNFPMIRLQPGLLTRHLIAMFLYAALASLSLPLSAWHPLSFTFSLCSAIYALGRPSYPLGSKRIRPNSAEVDAHAVHLVAFDLRFYYPGDFSSRHRLLKTGMKFRDWVRSFGISFASLSFAMTGSLESLEVSLFWKFRLSFSVGLHAILLLAS